MYTYRMYNRYSTKKSEAHNDQGEVVAYIERTYSNPLMRLLDIMTEGAMFTDYRITDANDKLVVEANQVRTFIRRRQYDITYYSSEGTSKKTTS